MKRKRSRIGPIVCILGGALLLAPIVFAHMVTASFNAHPTGVGTNNVNAYLQRDGRIHNDHAFSITAKVHSSSANFMEFFNGYDPWEVPAWSIGSGTFLGGSVYLPPNTRTRYSSSGGELFPSMVPGNQYWWTWESYLVSATCGSSVKVGSGSSDWYYCVE